jgi:hypothetical protein
VITVLRRLGFTGLGGHRRGDVAPTG